MFILSFFISMLSYLFFIPIYILDNLNVNFYTMLFVYPIFFLGIFFILILINLSDYINKNLKLDINQSTEKEYENEKSTKMITSKSGIFITFEKYFYPFKYKNEFDKIIRKHFDNITNILEFEEWLEYDLITVENLYYSIINKKEIQEEILKSIEETKRNNENECLKERKKIDELKSQIKSFQKSIIKINFFKP